MNTRSFCLPTLLLFTPVVTAQDPQKVIEEGDLVAGVGTVTSIFNLAVNNSGTTLVEADTDNADTDADSVLVRDAVLELREGQALPQPVGATLDSFDSVNLNASGDSGWNFFLDGTSGSNDDSGLYYNTTLVIQEGALTTAPEFTAGTPYIGFFEAKMNDTNQMLLIGSLDDPNIASSVDRGLMRIDVDGSGGLLSESAYLKEGDPAPNAAGETITDFGTSPHEFTINNSGDLMFAVDLTGGTSSNGVYLNMNPVGLQATPSPVAGRNWDSLSSTELDMNSSGDYVFSGTLDGDTASNLLLVKNGAKFRQEGDTLPSIGGTFTFTSFGTGPLWISDGGEVLWFGDWNDPDTTVDTGLFIDDELLVQEGVTTVNGVVIDSLSGVQDGYAMSRNGRYVLFEATLQGGVNGAYVIDRGSLGSKYCTANNNSTGSPADLAASGSASSSAGDLMLESAPVPNQSGIFFHGMNQTQVPFGNGFLCTSGGLVRGSVVVASSNVAGYTYDNSDTKHSLNAYIGLTRNFQHWFRDPMGGGAAHNTSNAVSISILP